MAAMKVMPQPGELVDVFTAWHEQERLGDFRVADGARLGREACERHAKHLQGLAGAVNTGQAITQHAETERSA